MKMMLEILKRIGGVNLFGSPAMRFENDSGGEPGADGSFDTSGRAGGGGEPWYSQFEAIAQNDELKSFASKYASAEEAIKGGMNAQKAIGSSFRLPEDTSKLNDEQKAQLMGYINNFREIPDDPSGYELQPNELRGQELTDAFASFAKENGLDKQTVHSLVDWFDNANLAMSQKAQEIQTKQANDAERDLRIEKGAGFEDMMKGVTQVLMLASDELGLSYEDDKGQLRSKINDCLDETALGNRVPLLKLLSWVYDKHYADGEPIQSAHGVVGGTKSFFDYPSMDK